MALLNEEINYKVERTKNGTPIAYIDPKTSENVYNFKDVIKKYGGKWDSFAKRWYWWLSTDKAKTQQILNNQVNPAIDELTKIETPIGDRRNSNDIKAQVAKMVEALDVILTTPIVKTQDSNTLSDKDIKNKVASFKEKLVSITSSEEFKMLLGPIIKFKQALGHSYSFGNTILIWLQDPKATMVKSRSRWAKVNRRVKEGAPAIMLYSPVGLEPYTPEQKKEITANHLKKWGAKSIKDLTPGQKEILSVKLSGGNPKGFKLTPSFYDHRFTELIEGKEDLAPKANTDEIEWFDDKTPSSEKTVALYDAAIASIQEVGLSVGFVDDLGGARGVSTNGRIEVLKNTSKNIGDFNTLVHEFSHELLHQKYLKARNETEYGSFFVGTDKGRAMVEQQAELSAWIICQYFGYEMPTSINYMGCWGMDEKSAARVFDTVANTSSYIIELVVKNMNKTNLQEGVETGSIISGEDIANMVGLGNLYRKSKQMEMQNTIGINESDIEEMVTETVKRILKERTKSEKGLSDDEVTRKRTQKFANSVDPEYGDSIYDDEQQKHFDSMNARRKMHHKMTQKHGSDIEEMVTEAIKEYIEPRVVNIDNEKLKNYVDNNKGEQFQEWYDTQPKTNDELNNYTHFAVNKKTNLIVNGWDYSDYDNSELRAFANDYFWDDMRDYEFNPKDYRILSRKGCLKLGINPDDIDNCWSNRGEIPCAQERMNK